MSGSRIGASDTNRYRLQLNQPDSIKEHSLSSSSRDRSPIQQIQSRKHSHDTLMYPFNFGEDICFVIDESSPTAATSNKQIRLNNENTNNYSSIGTHKGNRCAHHHQHQKSGKSNSMSSTQSIMTSYSPTTIDAAAAAATSKTMYKNASSHIKFHKVLLDELKESPNVSIKKHNSNLPSNIVKAMMASGSVQPHSLKKTSLYQQKVSLQHSINSTMLSTPSMLSTSAGILPSLLMNSSSENSMMASSHPNTQHSTIQKRQQLNGSHLLRSEDIERILVMRQEKSKAKPRENFYGQMMAETAKMTPVFSTNIAAMKMAKLAEETQNVVLADGSVIDLNQVKARTESINKAQSITFHNSQNKQFLRPDDRRDVKLLSEWMDGMVTQIFEEKKSDNFYENVEVIFEAAISEIARQLQPQCSERAQLLRRCWSIYTAIVAEFMLKTQKTNIQIETHHLKQINSVHKMYLADINALNNTLQEKNAQIESMEVYVNKLRSENRYLRKKWKRIEQGNELLREDLEQVLLERDEFVKEIQVDCLVQQHSGGIKIILYVVQKLKMKIEGLVISQQTESMVDFEWNEQKERFKDEVDKVRQQLLDHFTRLYEEQKFQLQEAYNIRQTLKEKEILLAQKLEEEDIEYQKNILKGPRADYDVFDEIVLDNKCIDTSDLFTTATIAVDTDSLIVCNSVEVQATPPVVQFASREVQATKRMMNIEVQVFPQLLLTSSSQDESENEFSSSNENFSEYIAKQMVLHSSNWIRSDDHERLISDVAALKEVIDEILQSLQMKKNNIDTKDTEIVANYLAKNIQSIVQYIEQLKNQQAQHNDQQLSIADDLVASQVEIQALRNEIAFLHLQLTHSTIEVNPSSSSSSGNHNKSLMNTPQSFQTPIDSHRSSMSVRHSVVSTSRRHSSRVSSPIASNPSQPQRRQSQFHIEKLRILGEIGSPSNQPLAIEGLSSSYTMAVPVPRSQRVSLSDIENTSNFILHTENALPAQRRSISNLNNSSNIKATEAEIHSMSNVSEDEMDRTSQRSGEQISKQQQRTMDSIEESIDPIHKQSNRNSLRILPQLIESKSTNLIISPLVVPTGATAITQSSLTRKELLNLSNIYSKIEKPKRKLRIPKNASRTAKEATCIIDKVLRKHTASKAAGNALDSRNAEAAQIQKQQALLKTLNGIMIDLSRFVKKNPSLSTLPLFHVFTYEHLIQHFGYSNTTDVRLSNLTRGCMDMRNDHSRLNLYFRLLTMDLPDMEYRFLMEFTHRIDEPSVQNFWEKHLIGFSKPQEFFNEYFSTKITNTKDFQSYERKLISLRNKPSGAISLTAQATTIQSNSTNAKYTIAIDDALDFFMTVYSKEVAVNQKKIDQINDPLYDVYRVLDIYSVDFVSKQQMLLMLSSLQSILNPSPIKLLSNDSLASELDYDCTLNQNLLISKGFCFGQEAKSSQIEGITFDKFSEFCVDCDQINAKKIVEFIGDNLEVEKSVIAESFASKIKQIRTRLIRSKVYSLPLHLILTSLDAFIQNKTSSNNNNAFQKHISNDKQAVFAFKLLESISKKHYVSYLVEQQYLTKELISIQQVVSDLNAL